MIFPSLEYNNENYKVHAFDWIEKSHLG